LHKALLINFGNTKLEYKRIVHNLHESAQSADENKSADARHLEFNNEFDLALLVCEGAFPLMETDEMNFRIIQNAARALKSGGKLILTTLNGLFPLFHSVKDFVNAAGGDSVTTENSFDLMTLY